MANQHSAALQTLYATVIEGVTPHEPVSLQSPGTSVRKRIGENEYAYWRSYRVDGSRHDKYLGAVSDPQTLQAVDERTSATAAAREQANALKLLRQAGWAVADNSSALTIAALHNAGIFQHGGVLVGSHAFGALLNGLGVKLTGNYRTDDIDIGTAAPITLAIADERSFLEVLRETGLDFLEVPELDPRQPSTSFKQRGKPLKVDLLVPGTAAYETRALPGVKAHATGLPYFHYLVEAVDAGYLLGKDHVVPVRIPNPARFALHKLIVSTLRPAAFGVKSKKDQLQALVMLDAVLEHNAAWVDDAIDALPEDARARVAQAADHTLEQASTYADRTRDTLEALAGLEYDVDVPTVADEAPAKTATARTVRKRKP